LVSAYNDLDDKTLDAVFDARVDKPAGRKELAAILGRAAESVGGRVRQEGTARRRNA
jgi:hypothetical protein